MNRATGTLVFLVSEVWVVETERWSKGRSEMQHANVNSIAQKWAIAAAIPIVSIVSANLRITLAVHDPPFGIAPCYFDRVDNR